jgi:DNA-binding PadR family transcriptional regulator
MNGNGYGYLAKLRAVAELKAPANTINVSRYLDVGYETARSALRRLERVGCLISQRETSHRWRPEVVYVLTDEGRAALARGVELSIPPEGKRHRPSTTPPRSPVAAPPEMDWRTLHEAMSMGMPIHAKRRGRVVRFALDTEPAGRWLA